MSERPGHGPWARLLATAVVRDEGSALAERGRALARDGEVGELDVELGRIAAPVGGCDASITARPVPARIWTAMVRSARGNRPLEAAIEGREQSVHLEHLMTVDWSEPLVPRSHDLGRRCSCDGADLCEHVAALAYAVADAIDADPSLLLRWRGCVAGAADEQDAGEVVVRRVEPVGDPWSGGVLPEPQPLRPLPVGAVLKRLGPSGLTVRGDDLDAVLQRAYASFAASAEH
jgi:SWIM zinc finger